MMTDNRPILELDRGLNSMTEAGWDDIFADDIDDAFSEADKIRTAVALLDNVDCSHERITSLLSALCKIAENYRRLNSTNKTMIEEERFVWLAIDVVLIAENMLVTNLLLVASGTSRMFAPVYRPRTTRVR